MPEKDNKNKKGEFSYSVIEAFRLAFVVGQRFPHCFLTRRVCTVSGILREIEGSKTRANKQAKPS